MKKIIALMILAATALPVAAHEENHAEGEGHAENYVGVSASKLTAAPKTTGAAIMVGHRYNEYLAGEIAYEDSAAVSSSVEKTTAFSIAAIGKVPFNASFEGYGRLGFAQAHSRDAAGLTANHGDVTYGLGVEYNVNANYSLGLGWSRLRIGDNVNILRANEDSYALTLLRNF